MKKKKNIDFGKKFFIIFTVTAIIFALVLWLTYKPLTVDNTPVEEFDSSLYIGEWYEVARLEQTFERGCECVKATYGVLTENTLSVNNYCRKADGSEKTITGYATLTDTPGLLQVTFPVFAVNSIFNIGSEYRVLYVDDDYEYAVVGGGSDGVLWILTKKDNPNQLTIDELVEFAEERGYAVEELIYPTGCN